MSGCDSTDSDGLRLLTSGSWNSGTTLMVQGGQGMHFKISNTNVLGTTITITAQSGESHSSIILPMGSVDLTFSIFGNEPMGWTFNISTDSDAFIVTWCLYSTWIPGDSPNPSSAPVVTGISPTSGTPGTTVTITGTGFAGVTDVGFGLSNVDILSATDTQIVVNAPGGNSGTTVDITVTTPAGTSATSSAYQFTYS